MGTHNQDYRHLVHLLRRRAQLQPDDLIYRFLHHGEQVAASLNYAQLDRRARMIAEHLTHYRVFEKPVLLLYPAGLEYLSAFLGCLYAGAIAVPAYPPSRHHTSRLNAIIHDAAPELALCGKELEGTLDQFGTAIPALGRIPKLITDQLDINSTSDWRMPDIKVDSLAFLQYTSGSTGKPKGVMVSHANLIENLASLSSVFRHSDRAPYVSWLPLYHDMGLIGVSLRSLYIDAPTTLMSPAAFMEKPIRWLRAISTYHGYYSGGPNFAYDLCLNKVRTEQCAGLDLSHWRVAFNGAEPIRANTLDRFASVFEPFGFDRSAFWSCYGMAEATIFVSGGKQTQPPRTNCFDADALARGQACAAGPATMKEKRLVSCGTAWRDEEIRVINPDTRMPCSENELGEIWVRGPSIAEGYWKQQELTREIFSARPAVGDRRYLRSGDLGFFYQGELYPTGRLKDLIIIRGLNIYPQDIEQHIEETQATGHIASSVAFAYEREDGEEVVVLCELSREALKQNSETHRNLCQSIRRELARTFELQPDVVLLAHPGSIAKTSSGKTMRGACARRWRAGDLRVVYENRLNNAKLAFQQICDETATQQTLIAQMMSLSDDAQKQTLISQFLRVHIAKTIGCDAVDIDQQNTLVGLGLDSLQSVNLKHVLDRLLQRDIPLSELMDDIPLEALAGRLAIEPESESVQLPVANRSGKEGPLSEGQKAIWFVQQQQANSIGYNLHLALRIVSTFDIGSLRKSLTALISRHPVLRTAYGECDGVPFQKVLSEGPGFFKVVNSNKWRSVDSQQAIRNVIATPFDLANGEVVRIRLFIKDKNDALLVLCGHHIALDFWSLVQLVQELGTLYRVGGEESRVVLPVPAASYGDFVEWQQQMLDRSAESDWKYWSTQLSGELNPVILPFDRSRPTQDGFQGGSKALTIDAATTVHLRHLASGHNTTFFTTLLTAFSALLYRYGGQRDMIIGVPTSGRVQQRFINTIGYFVNPVAMRLKPDSFLTFSEFLSETRRTVLAALKHQDFPFSTLIERLNPEREVDRYPLYQLAFALQTSQLTEQLDLASLALGEAGARMQWGGLEIESLTLDERVENFDLKLVMAETREGLSASFQYNRDLFDADTIEAMAAHFAILLGSIADRPETKLCNLPLFSEADHRRLMQRSESAGDSCPTQVVHSGIANQARIGPELLALSYRGETLSYSQLESGANQLAHHLQAIGVGLESVVALYLERGIDFVRSALAILKAGGAYLPLDPTYPVGRIVTILGEARVTALISTEDRLVGLERLDTQIILLDRDRATIKARPNSAVDVVVAFDNMAYLIYTSGSTGQPKGVCVSHRALANLIAWHGSAYPLKSDHRASQIAGLSFDASVWEIWAYLAAGASLHIVDEKLRLSPTALLAWLKQESITHCFLPTPLAEAVLKISWPEPLALQVLLTGGDRLGSVNDKRQSVRLVNHYGPTENAVVTSCAEVDWAATGLPSIGKAVDRVHLYILDANLNPLPLGCEGELYIGGASLARGYHHLPGPTADRFLPDPFAGEPGARMYLSGDRARYRKDGNVEYRGRSDQQIKIRGYRVEPAEIEYALNALPGVETSVVQMQPNSSVGQRLNAYVVPDEQAMQLGLEDPNTEENHVQDWTNLYQSTYGKSGEEVDSEFDISGWNSSYSGLPIATAEMRIWVEQTVAVLFAYKPVSVLEIGCGTGLLLTRIAPLCEAYHATDISQIALDRLTGYLNQKEMGHVSLEHCSAKAKPSGLGRTVDTVIVNSVVQYFPNSNYFLRMLDQILPSVVSGGRIFVGDVRNYRLLDVFHTDVQSVKAKSSLNVATFSDAVAAAGQSDHELLIDPGFFVALKTRYARITQVEIRLKHGDYDNELSRYRYDVTLHIDAENKTPVATPWSEWSEIGNLDRLYARLSSERPECLALRCIPHAHLSRAVAVVEALRNIECSRLLTVDKLRKHIDRLDTGGIDPETVYRLGESLGYRVDLRVAEQSERGVFDMILQVRTDVATILDMNWEMERTQDYTRYTNDPLRTRRLNQWIPRLRDALSRKLPDYMVPQSYIFLGELPITTNGKIDRKALPFLDKPNSTTHHIEARSVNERTLADIWRQVLGVAIIGVRDNFFELGGDSILSIQVVSRARASGLRLNPRQIFEHQTIENLAGLLDRQSDGISVADATQTNTVSLSDQQRAKLNTRFGTIEAIYPLSPLQTGLWFQNQYDREHPVYIEQLCLSLEGPLNIAAFIAAWRCVQARHTVLRTAFEWLNEEDAVQIVLATESIELPFYQLDWRTLVDQEAKLEAFLAQDYRQGFNDAEAPLMRISLIRTDDEHYRMVWTHHHLLIDGWSVSLLMDELFESYQASVVGRLVSFDTPVAYRHFIEWLSQSDRSRAERFWKKNLAGFDEPVYLRNPGSTRQKTTQSEATHRIDFQWDDVFTGETLVFCRQYRITINTLLQGAWAMLLSSYTGRRDLVFGFVDAGRQFPLEGIDRIVGLLINSLPLRVRLDLDQHVVDWLRILQSQILESSEHGYSGLSDIQRWSDCSAETPLFETLVAFENYPLTDFEERSFENILIRNISYRDRTHYPLTLVITPGERLMLTLGYQSHRFTRIGIQRMAAHFRNLVAGLIDHPNSRLATLTALDKSELKQLTAFSRARSIYPVAENLVSGFERQVALRADARAVVCESDQLSYLNLDGQANRLARALVTRGIGPGDRVAFCLERGLSSVVVLLGILKTGAAYVPLDPHDPTRRLVEIVEDAQVALLVVDSSKDWQHTLATEIVVLNSIPLDRFDRQALTVEIDSRWPAYIMYTSGSTGKPKGVCISHAQVIRLFDACEEYFDFRDSDVWTLFHSAAFDFSVWEFWGSFLHGACCVVVPYWLSRSPEAFRTLIDEQGVTILSQTPSAFYPLQDEILQQNAATLDSLRYVVFGGETLELARLRHWFTRFGDQHPELINMYGITETTVHVTAHKICKQELDAGVSNIGRPLADLSARVLNSRLQPMPIGVIGELYIGGAGVAQGYTARGALTAERFIPDLYSGDSGARLYRTGDLACYREDGSLEYHGRSDAQIKLRGHRIEIGEIEQTLLHHRSVKAVAVTLLANRKNEHAQLVAYLVGQPTDGSTLKSDLSERLPAFMLPQHFIWLDSLPLTANGKLDYRALPALDMESLSQEVLPDNEIESRLLTIWRDVLNVKRLGVSDNFFELGGDSILSMQVVNRARQQDIVLNPRQLFEHQDIRSLARVVDRSQVSQVPRAELPSGEVPLTPIQHWFFQQPLESYHHWNQALLLSMPEQRDPERLRRAWDATIAHHDSFRLHYRKDGDEWRQIYREQAGSGPFQVVNFSAFDKLKQDQSMSSRCRDAQRSFDLQFGPVIRALYFRLSPHRSDKLFICAHHLVIDGVSWRILLEDLETVYRQLGDGVDPSLPEKTDSFKQWSQCLTGYAASEALEHQRAYWLGLPWKSVESLRFDYPEAGNCEGEQTNLQGRLTLQETNALLTEAPSAYGTQINDLLLCALARGLLPETDGAPVRVDVEGHGRGSLFAEVDLSRTIGWFTIQYPVVLDSSGQGLGEDIKRTKEHLRRIPNQGTGFGLLRDITGGEKQTEFADLPGANVSFNYLGQFDAAWHDSSPLFAAPGSVTCLIGEQRAPESPRYYDIDINAAVVGGEFLVHWAYSRRYAAERIEALAERYLQALRILIEHCVSADSGGFTPSDFPLLDQLDQQAVDRLVGGL